MKHFVKWTYKDGEHFWLSSCGIKNPSNMVFFTLEASDAHEMMHSITCKECMNKTTIRDLT